MSDNSPPSPPTGAEAPKQAGKPGKGMGCLALIILCILIGWVADESGCGSGDVSPAFDAGYRLGLAAGKIDGAPGRNPPSESELDGSARQALKGSEYTGGADADREKYVDGFKGGYEVGFKESSKPAF